MASESKRGSKKAKDASSAAQAGAYDPSALLCKNFLHIFKKSRIIGSFSIKRYFPEDYAVNMKPLAADIAPWYRLRLPTCGRRLESQAHHLCFFQFVLLKL